VAEVLVLLGGRCEINSGSGLPELRMKDGDSLNVSRTLRRTITVSC
jgi:hypothetical protein